MPDSTNPTTVVANDPTPNWWASKKFWITIGTAIVSGAVTYVMKHFGSNVQEILGLVLPIVGVASVYILGQSIVDSRVYSTMIQANPNVPVNTDQPKP